MIIVNNLTHGYKVKKEILKVLDDVSFSLGNNETLGIIGYRGSGKSTLIKTINGLLKPTSGEVLIDGVDILKEKRKTINRMRSKIGMIFQDFNILDSQTVIEYIKFYNETRIQAKLNYLSPVDYRLINNHV